MRMNRKEFEKDEGRRGQQKLKEEFSRAIEDATTSKDEELQRQEQSKNAESRV